MLLVHPLDFLEESEKAFRGGPVVTEAFHFQYVARLLDTAGVSRPFVSASAAAV
jgi:hypothetical protein